MCNTFTLLAQKVEKLAAKHIPVYFETPCNAHGFLHTWSDQLWTFDFSLQNKITNTIASNSVTSQSSVWRWLCSFQTCGSHPLITMLSPNKIINLHLSCIWQVVMLPMITKYRGIQHLQRNQFLTRTRSLNKNSTGYLKEKTSNLLSSDYLKK